jgi:GAF domain-containing protein
MTTVSEQRLAKIFVEVADTLVDEFDLIEFLQMLADRAAGLIDTATVGLLLTDQHNRLQFMAASNETTKLLELFQLQWQDGPCLDAFRTAAPVVNADLRTANARWPRFAAYATAAGFRSVHAFPLRLRNEVIGAMGVFGTDATVFDDADVHIVQALADVAAIGLLQERAIHRGELLTEQLQGALNSRIIIEQAKGVLAERAHVGMEVAFARMRNHARNHNLKLIQVAERVLDGTLGVEKVAPAPS